MIIRTDWIPIALSLPNPNDYEAFLQRCREKGIMALSLMDYKKELNSLLIGKKAFSSSDPIASYTKVVESGTPITKRGCCGGGQTK